MIQLNEGAMFSRITANCRTEGNLGIKKEGIKGGIEENMKGIRKG